jgi:hypothetical protein
VLFLVVVRYGGFRALVGGVLAARALARRHGVERALGWRVEDALVVGLVVALVAGWVGAAVEEGRVVLTRNCGEFVRLSAATPSHFGILGVYHDADPSKDMSWNAIVPAVGNVEAAGVPLRGEFLVLNARHW